MVLGCLIGCRLSMVLIQCFGVSSRVVAVLAQCSIGLVTIDSVTSVASRVVSGVALVSIGVVIGAALVRFPGGGC